MSVKQVKVTVAQELSGHDAVVIKVYAMHIRHAGMHKYEPSVNRL